MPKDKTLSHEKINAAAKKEFLEKGFEKASMRSIGEQAGISSAGLYRHYKNKEDMFDALVRPMIDAMKAWYIYHKTNCYSNIDNNASEQELFSNTMIDFARDIIYPNKDEFDLLFKCSKGTKYENIVHEIVKTEQDEMMDALSYMREKGLAVKTISKNEMHLIMSAYTTALLEPFMHDMSEEQTENCLKTLEEFFMPGWQNIMGYKRKP